MFYVKSSISAEQFCEVLRNGYARSWLTGICCSRGQRRFGGVDLLQEQRANSSKHLWEEMKLIRQKRNEIVHQGATASSDEAELGVAVAAYMLEDVFPKVISNLGLYLHGTTIRTYAPSILATSPQSS